MTPPINRIDLERVLLALPPETQDPHPHLANLTAIELLKRRVLKPAFNAAIISPNELASTAEPWLAIRFAIAILLFAFKA